MPLHSDLDVLWIVVASALVFVMRVGFAMLESGMTRSKNSINVSTKVLTDLGVSLLVYWLLGFGLMFGASQLGLTGGSEFVMNFKQTWPSLFFLFHAMFASTSATIVSGAVAERIRFGSYLVITLMFSGFVYPVLGHWVWGGALEGEKTGWLVKMGFLDFAGGAVVHATGGWISLAVLLVLGPRIGRYNEDGSVNRITGAGLQTSIFGTLLLWFGWFGFNGGSTLAVNGDVPGIIVKTSLAGAAGMIVTLLVGWRLRGFPDVSLVINGALAGLVGVTAGAPYFNEGSAILVGALAGPIMLGIEALLDRLMVDDAVGAIPVHLGCGAWGILALALFGDQALWQTGLSRGAQFGVQFLGIAACGLWAFSVSFVFVWLLNKVWPIRVGALEEAQGLNVAEHKASTEIYDLYRTLEDQAKTGNLSLRAPVEPFTEVGQIASQYNRVMDNLQANLVARSEYVSILDNLHEGLFLLDPDGRLGPFYSAALETILETEGLAGRSLEEVLSPLTNPSALASWPDFLGVLFDAGVDDAVVQRLNPVRDLELTGGLGSGGLPQERHVQIQFRRIVEEGKVVRAMVIVRDMTEEIRLKKTLDLQHRDREQEMELFYKLLHVDPSLLSEFLLGFQDKTAQINRLMETGQNAPKEVIKQSLRILHSIKGEAALLELDFVAEAAHRLEDIVQDLQKKKVLANSDFLGFALRFGEFQEIGDRMSAMVGRLQGFQSSMVQAEKAPDALVVQLETLVRQTAEARGKRAELKADGLDPAHLGPRQAVWKDILLQLVRNAVVHGIEAPVLRENLRKPEVGTVTVTTRRSLGGVEVSVRDDGSGLDLKALRLKAKEDGWQDYQLDKWTKSDWIKFLFTDGVSTAAVGMEAGRGVGLSLVGRLVKEARGKLGVRFESEKFLEFQVTLPDPKTQG